jgi:DNA invertase Pin-like site-specific DNA recombinase
MEKTKNGLTYDDWVGRIAGWGMPDNLALAYYKKRRLPLSQELEEKRRQHMVELKKKGYSQIWIAKLYGLNRMQVYRIINNRHNH